MARPSNEQVAQDYAARHEDVLILTAGELSEDLIHYVASELDDDVLDGIEVHRDLERQDDLASEPITIGVVIGLSSGAVVAVGKIIERWIEKKRQRENIDLTIQAYKISSDAGRSVAELAKAHAEVSVSYSLESSPPPVIGLT